MSSKKTYFLKFGISLFTIVLLLISSSELINNKNVNDLRFVNAASVANSISLDSSMFTSILNDEIYTGRAITKKIVLKDKGQTISNTNYDVSYSNNVNVGTATILITGKEKYKGTISKTFKIIPRNVKINLSYYDQMTKTKEYDGNNKLKFKDGNYTKIYDYFVKDTNENIRLTLTVTFNDKNVGEGKPISLNVINTEVTNGNKKVNNYQISVTGTTGYKGNLTKKRITYVAVAQDKEYDGKSNAIIKLNNINGIVEGDDVQIENNISGSFDSSSIGTSKKVTPNKLKPDLSGVDSRNYYVSNYVPLMAKISKIIEKIIKPGDNTSSSQQSQQTPKKEDSTNDDSNIITLTDDMVTTNFKDETYNGRAITKSIILKKNGKSISSSYYTVSYSNNINVGTATVTITGKEKYKGTITKTFKIIPREVNIDLRYYDQLTKTKEYDGHNKLKFRDGNYTKNYDYKVSYTNETIRFTLTTTFDNKNAGTSKPIKLNIINKEVINGNKELSNYKLNIKESTTLKGNVSQKKLTYSSKAEDKVYDGNSDAKISVSNLTGVISGDEVEIESTVYGKFNNSSVGKNKKVTPNKSKPELSKKDSQNYYVVNFPYLSASIIENKNEKVDEKTDQSTEKVEENVITEDMLITVLDNETYTGKEIKKSITLRKNNVNISSSNYTVEYKNNINVGTATVIITGRDKYKGKIEKTFEILPKKVEIDLSSFSKINKTKEYDGNSSVKFSDGNYSYSYEYNISSTNEKLKLNLTANYDNKNAGTNKVITLNVTNKEVINGNKNINNYQISIIGNSSLKGVISQKKLTYTAVAQDKVFDESTDAIIAIKDLKGAIAGDLIDIENTVHGKFSSASIGSNKTVSPSKSKPDLLLSDKDNYCVSNFETLKANITEKKNEIEPILPDIEDGTSVIKKFDISSFDLWRVGNYSNKTGEYESIEGKMCLKETIKITNESVIEFKYNIPNYRIAIVELDGSKKIIKKEDTIYNGDLITLDKNTKYLTVTLRNEYDTKYKDTKYKSDFEKGLIVNVNVISNKRDAFSAPLVQAKRTEKEIDISNLNLWQAGDINEGNGKYFASKTTVTLKDMIPSNKDRVYKVSISNSKYKIKVLQYNKNDEIIYNKTAKLGNGEKFSTLYYTEKFTVAIITPEGEVTDLTKFASLINNGLKIKIIDLGTVTENYNLYENKPIDDYENLVNANLWRNGSFVNMHEEYIEYSPGTEKSMALKYYLIVNPENKYKVHIGLEDCKLVITQIDKNMALIKSNYFANGSEFITADNTKYLAIAMTNTDTNVDAAGIKSKITNMKELGIENLGKRVIGDTSLKINEQSIVLYPGWEKKLTFALKPNEVTSNEVILTSSNPDIVSIKNGNVIVANKAGKATITGKTARNGNSAETSVEVINPSSRTLEEYFRNISSPKTPVLNNLGIPFRANNTTDVSTLYSRNIWTLQNYQNKVFIGYGDFATNKGPIDSYWYNPITNGFELIQKMQTEQISRFIILDGKLYMPSIDPKLWEMGYFYVYNGLGWESAIKIPGALHSWDMYKFKNKYFLGVSDNYDGGSCVYMSTDNKNYERVYCYLTEEDYKLGKSVEITSPTKDIGLIRSYRFFELNGILYTKVAQASVNGIYQYDEAKNCFIRVPGAPLESTRSDDPVYGTQYAYSYDEDTLRNVNRIRRMYNPQTNRSIAYDSSKFMFPARCFTGDDAYYEIRETLNYKNRLVYIASYELRSTADMKNFKAHTFGSSKILTTDILESNGTLFILTIEKLGTKKYTNKVYKTNDMENFTEVLRFTNCPELFRSMEYVQEKLIFGSGTLYNEGNSTSGNMYMVDLNTLK